MKRLRADDSADSRVKVGHRQAFITTNPRDPCDLGGFVLCGINAGAARALRNHGSSFMPATSYKCVSKCRIPDDHKAAY